MQDAKQAFAQRLREAMVTAGYEPRPTVLEREFNTRHWGKPMTLHGVRRWLLGETMPDHKKLATLAKWLGISIQELGYSDVPSAHQVRERQPIWNEGLGYQDRELFEIYLSLPIPKRRLAREMILAIARANAAEEANATDSRKRP